MLGLKVCLALLAITAFAVAKPPGPSPWASYAGKPVYARALGPPAKAGISSITVPFKPKTPFFPKFVDPATMISKKNDMLANLFGGLGPANYPAEVPADGFSNVGATKPVLYAEEPVKEETSDIEEILGAEKTPTTEVKRGLFGPKFGPMGPKFGPGSFPFSPFSPMSPFSPFGSKFGAMDASDASDSSELTSNTIDSRRKRSITGSGDGTSGSPPAYPGLGPIPEEPETDSAGTPKQYLPGMFGPFGTFAPSPIVDPSMFASKKTTFLDTLFKNLATSTPPPVDTVTDFPMPKPTIVPAGFWSPFNTVTDIPVPKSTIVPPDFWVPSSIIPGPMEYTNKVSDFLDKLFNSIMKNKTMTAAASDPVSPKTAFVRSLAPEEDFPKAKIVERSVEDLTTISAAKDAIVDSIISELGSLKTDMFNTMNDFIAAQTPVAPVSPFAMKPTKPGKPGKPVKPASPFKTAFASMWAPPPPVDTTLPFKQKMTVLSQVFDMLTGLQKNITLAIQDSIAKSTSTDAPIIPQPADDDGTVGESFSDSRNIISPFNMTLLDALKNKLASLDSPAPMNPYMTGKYARAVPPKSASPLWGKYPGSMPAKREINDDEDVYENREHHTDNSEQFKRNVKMSMHQGYQSMPPGTIETVQAGGGSVPGHQGGGIKLLDEQPKNYEDYADTWTQWAEYMKKQNEGRRNHHHNHH